MSLRGKSVRFWCDDPFLFFHFIAGLTPHPQAAESDG